MFNTIKHIRDFGNVFRHDRKNRPNLRPLEVQSGGGFDFPVAEKKPLMLNGRQCFKVRDI